MGSMRTGHFTINRPCCGVWCAVSAMDDTPASTMPTRVEVVSIVGTGQMMLGRVLIAALSMMILLGTMIGWMIYT